ncbi:MAG: hypothetical protein JKY65_21135 [Planctomycetes bacterium]|nr:hypothetical protein [Planctomycetota bacterium]
MNEIVPASPRAKARDPKLALLALATGLHVLLWLGVDRISSLPPAGSYALSAALVVGGVALMIGLARSWNEAARPSGTDDGRG